MTEDAKSVRVSNDFLAATLSRDRLHVVGLALADGKTANLLQRVVTIHHSAWEKMPGAASAGLWLEEDSGRGAFAQWETKVEPTADAVVASAHTSDQFFKYQRVVRVGADAPFVEVRYVWDCTKTFRTVSAHSIPDVCFDKEVDEAAWEDADGRVEKLLMLQDGKASKAWDEARGAYAYALTVGGHWFAARSTKTSEGLVAFMPTREGVGTRVTTGYTWDPRIHLAVAPPLGRRPNPPMPGDKVESHVFLMPFRGEPQEAAQKLVKLLGWTRPEAKPTASSGLARLLLAAPDLTAWHEAPVVKVRRNQQPPADGARPVVELAAAKDEYESTQIVLRSEKALREVSLTAGPLVGAIGRIEARDIEINPVGYVRTASPPNEIPDLLLPNRKVELVTGRAQPFWVTVHVPREAAAGKYEGVLKLTGAGLGETSITLRLTVHDFALPATRHLRTSFGFRAQYLAAKYGTDEGWRALAAYAREYQRARLSWGMHVTPGELPRTVRDGKRFKVEGFDDWAQRAEKVIREYACNTFAVLRFPGFPPGVKWAPAGQGHGRGELNITPEVE
ncbi:MAG: hypothetical protein FJ272_20465, partial [Planctomycetes bacterium]|nr:hypothetical protein [Planctomycetota bacterium]